MMNDFNGVMGDLKYAYTEDEQRQFIEYKRHKARQEALARVTKIEADCTSTFTDKEALRQFCHEAQRIGIGGVVVLPFAVKACVLYLGKEPTTSLIGAVSCPHGGDVTEIKVTAVKKCVRDGVDEVEVYAPATIINDGGFAYFKRECRKIKKAAKIRTARVVFNAVEYSQEKLIKACQTACDGGITCIRINGATPELIQTLKSAVKDRCLVKCDGCETEVGFQSFLDNGADITSSKCAFQLATDVLAKGN